MDVLGVIDEVRAARRTGEAVALGVVVVRVVVRRDLGAIVGHERDGDPLGAHEGLDEAVIPAFLDEVPGPEIDGVAAGDRVVDFKDVVAQAFVVGVPVGIAGMRRDPRAVRAIED